MHQHIKCYDDGVKRITFTVRRPVAGIGRAYNPRATVPDACRMKGSIGSRDERFVSRSDGRTRRNPEVNGVTMRVEQL